VDVIVSDIDMPGMSGLELVKIVRRERPSTQRMLLSGAATMDRALDAINEGEVHRFFTKPFDVGLFNAGMRDVLERIEKLRQEEEIAARAALRNELFSQVDAAFPGSLDVLRNARGEIVLTSSREDLELLHPGQRRGTRG